MEQCEWEGLEKVPVTSHGNEPVGFQSSFETLPASWAGRCSPCPSSQFYTSGRFRAGEMSVQQGCVLTPGDHGRCHDPWKAWGPFYPLPFSSWTEIASIV